MGETCVFLRMLRNKTWLDATLKFHDPNPGVGSSKPIDRVISQDTTYSPSSRISVIAFLGRQKRDIIHRNKKNAFYPVEA